MTNSLRERRRQLLRDEILNAAQELVALKGYTAVSMDEIAAHVGISKPTLYSHFATKDDLVVAAVTTRLQRLVAHAEELPSEETPLQRLLLLMRLILEEQIKRPALTVRPWSPELFQTFCKHDDSVSMLRRFDAGLLRLIQAALANGEMDSSLDGPAVLRLFYAAIGSLHFAAFGLGAGVEVDREHSVNTVLTIFERGVRPPPLR